MEIKTKSTAALRVKVSYYSSPHIDPRLHAVVQISRGEPRYGAMPVIELPDLAPSLAIRNAAKTSTFEEVAAMYFEQLDAFGIQEIKELLAKAEAQATGKELVLCCFESLKKPGQHCHRQLFSQWFKKQTGIVIPELGDLATTPALLTQSPG